MTTSKKNKQSAEISQIHRLRGQLAGVEKMLATKAKPADIIQQIEAVRGNLRGLQKRILGKNCRQLKDADLKKSCEYLLKLF